MKMTYDEIKNLPDGDVVVLRRDRVGGGGSNYFTMGNVGFTLEEHRPAPKPPEPLKLEGGCRVLIRNTTESATVQAIFGEFVWVTGDQYTCPRTCQISDLEVIGSADNPWNLKVGDEVQIDGSLSPIIWKIVKFVTSKDGSICNLIHADGKPGFNLEFSRRLRPARRLRPVETQYLNLKWENNCIVESKVDRQRRVVICHYNDEFWGGNLAGKAIGISRKCDFEIVKAAPKD